MNVDGTMSTLRVVSARQMAAAALVSFEHAEEEGRPLSQVQQIDVVANLMMAYADLVHETERSLNFENEALPALLRRSLADLFQGAMPDAVHVTGIRLVEEDEPSDVEKVYAVEDMAYDDQKMNAEEAMQGLSLRYAISTAMVTKRGPGGGWPVIRIEGARDRVEACLRGAFDVREDDLEDHIRRVDE